MFACKKIGRVTHYHTQLFENQSMVYLIHWKKQRAMELTAPTDSSTTAHQDQWIHITDEMIVDVGYKSSTRNKSNNRSQLFHQLKKRYIKDKAFHQEISL